MSKRIGGWVVSSVLVSFVLASGCGGDGSTDDGMGGEGGDPMSSGGKTSSGGTTSSGGKTGGDTGGSKATGGSAEGGMAGKSGSGGQESSGGSEATGGEGGSVEPIPPFDEICQTLEDHFMEVQPKCIPTGTPVNEVCIEAGESKPACEDEFFAWQQCLLERESFTGIPCIFDPACAAEIAAWNSCSE